MEYAGEIGNDYESLHIEYDEVSGLMSSVVGEKNGIKETHEFDSSGRLISSVYIDKNGKQTIITYNEDSSFSVEYPDETIKGRQDRSRQIHYMDHDALRLVFHGGRPDSERKSADRYRSEAMALMNPSFPSINDSPPVNPFLAKYADIIPL